MKSYQYTLTRLHCLVKIINTDNTFNVSIHNNTDQNILFFTNTSSLCKQDHSPHLIPVLKIYVINNLVSFDYWPGECIWYLIL